MIGRYASTLVGSTPQDAATIVLHLVRPTTVMPSHVGEQATSGGALRANTWTERSPMPTSRDHAFSGVVNNKIYVIGGRIGAGNVPATSNIDVVEEYDPATNLWGAVKQKMPTPRSGGGVATYNGRIYVAGGEITNRQFSAAFRALGCAPFLHNFAGCDRPNERRRFPSDALQWRRRLPTEHRGNEWLRLVCS